MQIILSCVQCKSIQVEPWQKNHLQPMLFSCSKTMERLQFRHVSMSFPLLVGTYGSRTFFQLETCLKHIFAKYCSPSASRLDKKTLLQPPHNGSLSPEGLDAWAKDTNGAPFSQETKDELVEFLDVAEDGSLTWEKDASQKFRAPQLYQPAWKDFYRFISYKLKTTRRKLGGI